MYMFERNIDYEYVAKREEENDFIWQYYEKGLYYSSDNENYVIPTFILCLISLFTSPVGIAWCFLISFGSRFLAYCNNLKLDRNPRVVQRREEWKKANENVEKRNTQYYFHKSL